MADANSKSLSISRELKERAKAWVERRNARGNDDIPSVANLVNRLLAEFLIQQGETPEEIKEIIENINKAAKHVSRHIG